MRTHITAAKDTDMRHLNIFFLKDAAFLDAAVREREEELSRRTLQALLDMRIKFPGKSDEEAEVILDSVSVGHYAGCFWSFGKSLDKFILDAKRTYKMLSVVFPVFSDSR